MHIDTRTLILTINQSEIYILTENKGKEITIVKVDKL